MTDTATFQTVCILILCAIGLFVAIKIGGAKRTDGDDG